MTDGACKEPGCFRGVHAREWCKYHYALLRPRSACSILGCVKRAQTAGLCSAHYARSHRTGDPFGSMRPDLATRFWAKVDKDGPIPGHRPDLGPCWVWTGAVWSEGRYGCIRIGGRNGRGQPVHVVAWEMENGPVPEGLELDHLCRLTLCVRPSHVEAVTHRENLLRGMSPMAVAYRQARGLGVCYS